MLLVFRVTAVVHTLAFFMQPVLAGMFLSGQDSAIAMHRANATIVTTICLALTVLAFLAWRRQLIRRRLLAMLAAILLLEYVEMSLGGSHILLVHIPLGVGLFATVVATLPMVMKAAPVAPQLSLTRERAFAEETVS
ncbi:hypothetical protein [Actinacidiphila paucisporea]|uniref:Uncharacterized protein n=1 Tax=Actinacidiphila paucisporea TaxID=310782 RepID=A0A1M7MN66_9ACTN|nr:hypothetical protein [Actinacidiphila paucisporea]SHM92392.1 hypothetical protein SAMN05216499_116113 [Actinacidiphila paucisporea]